MSGIIWTRWSINAEQHPHWQTEAGSSAGVNTERFCDIVSVKLVCTSWGSGPKKHKGEFKILFYCKPSKSQVTTGMTKLKLHEWIQSIQFWSVMSRHLVTRWSSSESTVKSSSTHCWREEGGFSSWFLCWGWLYKISGKVESNPLQFFRKHCLRKCWMSQISCQICTAWFVSVANSVWSTADALLLWMQPHQQSSVLSPFVKRWTRTRQFYCYK